MASGDKYICNNCSYMWQTRKKFGSPAKCPSCNDKNIALYLIEHEYARQEYSVMLPYILRDWKKIQKKKEQLSSQSYNEMVKMFYEKWTKDLTKKEILDIINQDIMTFS